jgi:hypothetical protein
VGRRRAGRNPVGRPRQSQAGPCAGLCRPRHTAPFSPLTLKSNPTPSATEKVAATPTWSVPQICERRRKAAALWLPGGAAQAPARGPTRGPHNGGTKGASRPGLGVRVEGAARRCAPGCNLAAAYLHG